MKKIKLEMVTWLLSINVSQLREFVFGKFIIFLKVQKISN